MSTTMAVAVLACTGAAMAAEVIALVRVDDMLALVWGGVESTRPSRVHRLLALLSLFYACDLGLLLLSGDPMFRMYAVAMIVLGGLMWAARKYVVRWRAVVMLESTVCLVLLTDVAYTVLRTQGWLAF